MMLKKKKVKDDVKKEKVKPDVVVFVFVFVPKVGAAEEVFVAAN